MTLVHEGFSAADLLTFVWFLSGVQSIVRLKDALLVKSAPTSRIGTLVVSLTKMSFFMDLKSLRLAVRFFTPFEAADIFPDIPVDFFVNFKSTARNK